MTRYQGRMKAFVRDNRDPEKLGRVRCYCPAVMGLVDSTDYWLGWAVPSHYFGHTQGVDSGSLVVPDVNTAVWLEFEQGNVDFPILVGTVVLGEDPASSTIPELGKGEESDTEGDQHTVGGVSVPRSAGGHSVYPKNRMMKTSSGHIIEIDDTDGNKRVRIRHADGSFLEFKEGGMVVLQALSDLYTYVAETLGIAVGGDINLAAGGQIRLGSASASLGVARVTDTVTINAALMVTLTQITALLNAPGPVIGVPGAVTPFTNPTVGTITSGSTKVRSD